MAAVAIVIGLSLSSAAAGADIEAELAERRKIVDEVERRMSDTAAREQALAAGLERSVLCASCHGVDGNSKKSEYPNLASQNPSYMIEQMQKFKDGRRKSFVMEALVKNFSLEDKINLAVYFTSQQLKPSTEANAQLADRGATIYKQSCTMCHGESGKGEEGFARIAGQRVEYVVTTLKRFRDNAKRGAAADESKRSNARMEQVTQFLSDSDIGSLANYLALLK